MDPLGELGGPNLYRFARNNSISYIDFWGLLSLVFDPSSSLEFIEYWRTALMELLKTPTGIELIKMCPGKTITIGPGETASGGTQSFEHPTGSIALNPDDPLGVSPTHRLELEPPFVIIPELPPDTILGAAVVIGHEIGHAGPDYYDPENVVWVENPLRVELGLPLRPAYHGRPLP